MSSPQFEEGQSVRYCGITFYELFKIRKEKIWRTINSCFIGFKVGTVSVRAPTCAYGTTPAASQFSSNRIVEAIGEENICRILDEGSIQDASGK
jgi:hypothetical protein